jgi:uncharacterized iron-regulated membrane protein
MALSMDNHPANKRLRTTLRWLHRWIGLTLGLIFAAVSLSGSLLLFQEEFFEWAHGEMIPDGLSAEIGSLDAWIENAKAAAPGLGQPTIAMAPHVSHNVTDAGMVFFMGLEPGGFGNMGLLAVLVEPATGAVLGTVDVDHSPAYAPILFHRDIWAGESGRVVSGVMGVGSVLLLAIGLYLWWPSRRQLAAKMSPRPLRVTFTRSKMLHDWLGFWSLLLVFVLAFTGLYLVQPEWVQPAVDLIPGAGEEELHEAEHAAEAAAAESGAPAPACAGPAMGFDAALARARALAPGAALTAFYPEDETFRHWQFAFAAGGDTDRAFGDIRVVADLACGTVELTENAMLQTTQQKGELWLSALHDGTAFGLAGEILVTVLGFVPVVLAWTGVQMWLRGRRTAARKKEAVEAALAGRRS